MPARVEPHALSGEFVLVSLVRLIQSTDKPRPFCVQLGNCAVHVTQPPLRGREAGFGLGQLAREAGRFGADLVERNLLGALFVFEHQQTLARPVEFGFECHHAPVCGRKPLIEPAVFFAQSLAFAGLLSKSCLEVNDLRASCSNIDGDLCFRGFERSKQVLRRRKLLTQRLTFFFRKFGLFLELSNFVAQLA